MMGLGFFASFLICLFARAAALPGGFIVETVTSQARGTTGVFVPHPAGKGPPILVMVSKQGLVTVLENPDESPETKVVLDLSDEICTNGERGLQSVAGHPDFANNRFLYLFYTKKVDGCPMGDTDGTWNVIDRLEMNPATLELDFDDRTEIWRTSRLSEDLHNGGAMEFGSDGKLYVTTGDSGSKTRAKPLDNVLGSIVRLNDDGSVPDDNPYTRQNGYENSYRCADTEGTVPTGEEEVGVCAEVFANGLRNPFRMRMDPNEREKVRFTVSDVGGSYWEELSMGGTDYAARNYGWPDKEGPCKKDRSDNCPFSDEDGFVEPYHYYEHRAMKEGGCVAGSAYVPPDLWPPKYKFLFIDFIFLEIYNLIEDPELECRSCTPPTSGYRNETFYRSIQKEGQHVNNARMVDMVFGPYKDTQALYVFRFGESEHLLRIRYNGIVDNALPVASFEVPGGKNPSEGDRVRFDSSTSSDPEGLGLSYDWDFGDGSTSDQANPNHVFEDRGEYNVVLKVTDSHGQTQQTTEKIVVGTRPTATILSPPEGAKFYVGDPLQLVGEAYDHKGKRLDDTQLTWEVRKHHADHFHPFLDPTPGNDLVTHSTPGPEDFFAATNSYFRVVLVATDEDGVTTETHRIVRPRLVTVDLTSQPEGLSLLVDDYELTMPGSMTSWRDHYLRLEAPDRDNYVFSSWSDGSTEREHTIQLTDKSRAIRAIFCGGGGANCDGDGDGDGDGECCSGICEAGTCSAPAPAPVGAVEEPVSVSVSVSTPVQSPLPKSPFVGEPSPMVASQEPERKPPALLPESPTLPPFWDSFLVADRIPTPRSSMPTTSQEPRGLGPESQSQSQSQSQTVDLASSSSGRARARGCWSAAAATAAVAVFLAL